MDAETAAQHLHHERAKRLRELVEHVRHHEGLVSARVAEHQQRADSAEAQAAQGDKPAVTPE